MQELDMIGKRSGKSIKIDLSLVHGFRYLSGWSDTAFKEHVPCVEALVDNSIVSAVLGLFIKSQEQRKKQVNVSGDFG
jgi:hypothetical protein